MRLSVWVLLAMAGWAWGEHASSTNSIYEEHFPPIHANCTQSLTDLLLLRQEIQLQKMVSILTEIRDSTPHTPRIRGTEWSCPSNFMKVGDMCLYLAKEVDKSWDAARAFCQNMGADLVVFPDANNFAAALPVIKSLGLARDTHIWVGGHDQVVEGDWMWITGDPMPRGTPFWGQHDTILEPQGGRTENCALIYETSHFLIHDAPCGWNCKPLCQIEPISRRGDQG